MLKLPDIIFDASQEMTSKVLPGFSLIFGTAGWVRNGLSLVLIGVLLPIALNGLTVSPAISFIFSLDPTSWSRDPLPPSSNKRSSGSLRSLGLHLGIFPSQLPSALHISFGLPTRTYRGDVQ